LVLVHDPPAVGILADGGHQIPPHQVAPIVSLRADDRASGGYRVHQVLHRDGDHTMAIHHREGANQIEQSLCCGVQELR
jgi:hypothetical protein